MIHEELLPRLLPLPSCPTSRRQRQMEGPFSLKPDMRPPRASYSASAYTPVVSQVRLPETLGMFENLKGYDPSQSEIHYVKFLSTKSKSVYSSASVGQASNISSSPYGPYSHLRSPTDMSRSPSTVTGPIQSPTLNISPPTLGVEPNTLPDLQIQKRA